MVKFWRFFSARSIMIHGIWFSILVYTGNANTIHDAISYLFLKLKAILDNGLHSGKATTCTIHTNPPNAFPKSKRTHTELDYQHASLARPSVESYRVICTDSTKNQPDPAYHDTGSLWHYIAQSMYHFKSILCEFLSVGLFSLFKWLNASIDFRSIRLKFYSYNPLCESRTQSDFHHFIF